MSIFTAMLVRDSYRTDRVILKNGKSIITEVNGRTMDGKEGSCFVNGEIIEVERVDEATWRQK